VKLFENKHDHARYAVPRSCGLTAGKLLAVRSNAALLLCASVRLRRRRSGRPASSRDEFTASHFANFGLKTSHLHRRPCQLHAAVKTLDAPDTS